MQTESDVKHNVARQDHFFLPTLPSFLQGFVLYLIPLPLYGSGGLHLRMLAEKSPTITLSLPLTVILVFSSHLHCYALGDGHAHLNQHQHQQDTQPWLCH